MELTDPKECRCCGKVHYHDYDFAKYLGRTDLPLDWYNCECGTTLVISSEDYVRPGREL